MKLTFKTSHLSIKEFPSTVTSSFTLITGLSAAGKSHLLQAIASGKILVDGIKDPQTDIRYFDWTNMVPKDTGGYASTTQAEERLQLYKTFEKISPEYRGKVEAARNAPSLVTRAVSRVLAEASPARDGVRHARLNCALVVLRRVAHLAQ
jgi:hypothetical protein